MIRHLSRVIHREKAAIGLFVTLTKPTRPMWQEAVKAGYYQSPTGTPCSKIQILTVEGLLEGTERPRYLDLMQGGLTLQKSKPEIVGVQLNFDSLITDSVEVQITEEIKGVARSCAHHVALSGSSQKIAQILHFDDI